MKVTSENIKGCAVFYIEGSVELFAADEIGKIIATAIKKQDYDKVILHLGGVDYIDSTGIGALLKTAADYRGRTAIRLCSLQPGITNLFKVINLNRLIPVDVTLDDSVRALTQG